MNNPNETNEYLCLKLLLEKWKLPHLLHHFISQKINMEILKIMKYRHISEAVSCFPLGDRIRFEHELENWRQCMGIPLDGNKTSTEQPTKTQSESYNSLQKMLEEAESIVSKATATVTKETETIQPTESTTTPATASEEQRPLRTATPPMPPITLRTPTQEAPTANKVAIPRLRASKRQRRPYTTAKATTTAKYRAAFAFVPPKDLIAGPLTIDAHAIILQCVPRGPQLMSIYEARGTFTTSERTELINLFAKFFFQHSIHLSLKMSYALENQILKLFPGERLKDYRTEKRGRIYIRLGNIKNFKARSERAKKQQDSVEQFVITSVPENDEESVMIDDDSHEVSMLDESNSVEHVLDDDIRTDMESNSAVDFFYDKVKTEIKEEKELFEPAAHLAETQASSDADFE